jgi:hypothetical protein
MHGSGGQEKCRKHLRQSARDDVRSLGPIVRDLITGDCEDDETVLEGWSKSLDFEREVARATSTADVLQVWQSYSEIILF